jgi:Reverse transcriptase (RNA-dependent DNA polymerase)
MLRQLMDARPGSSGKDDPAPSPVRLDPLHHATTAETVYAILAQAAADVNEDWCIDEHAALAAELSDLTAFSAMPIVNDPLTRTEALNSSTAPQWAAAMQSEYDSLINAKTYTLIPRPPHCRPIDCKWVLKTKRNAQGVLIKHKARLVARGYAQRYGVDYEETYAPVCRQGSIRMLCALAAQHDWEIHQMDVVSAFLNGVLEETVYMEQPEGFVIPGKEDWVCKLSKSLYGLKQAGRTWYQKIDVTLKQTHGFSALSTDQCVYIRKDMASLIIIALYVDDLLIFSNSIPALTSFKQTLTTEFAMQDLGEASLILGIEISRNRAARTLSLSQSGYVRDLLKRHDMGECNAVLTPVEKGVVQRKSVEDYVAAAEMTKRYQSIVGAVMYAMCCTRPDIAFTISTLSQYSSNPDKLHWRGLQHLLRYLKGTIDHKLTYQGTGTITTAPELNGYCDADYGGDLDGRRSTTGYVFLLCGAPISWQSKKQKTVAMSSCESEYMALASAVKEVLWLRALMKDLGYNSASPTKLWCDNQGAIRLAKNPEHHERTKHIDIRYHLIRLHLEEGVVDLQHVSTLQQAADCLTKGLEREKHSVAVRLLGMAARAERV